ncbi:hypothetical protein [Moorena producens]|nr:hypothetical protein [Moorena producens]
MLRIRMWGFFCRTANKGTPLEPLPFSGSVYILGTGENISANEDRLSFNIFNRKALSKSICDNFGLYKLP